MVTLSKKEAIDLILKQVDTYHIDELRAIVKNRQRLDFEECETEMLETQLTAIFPDKVFRVI